METTINRRSKIHKAISNWLKLCFLISLVLRIPIEKQLAIRPPKPMPIKKVLHVQHIAMKELTLVTRGVGNRGAGGATAPQFC